MSLLLVLLLSITTLAQTNASYETDDLVTLNYENLVYEEECSALRMGLRLDFGGSMPIIPHTSDAEPVSVYIGNGWYSISNDYVIELRIPSIQRYSSDMDIKITEEDLEILLEFAYQIISERRPLGYDEYFISALKESGLYESFFSRTEAMLLNQLSESERAELSELRELRELYSREIDIIPFNAGEISPFNLTISLANQIIPARTTLYNATPSARLILGDRVHYSFSLSNTNSGVRTDMHERRPASSVFWYWQTYFGSTITRNANNAANVSISSLNLSFGINNGHPNIAKRISSGSYTIRW